MKKTLFVMFDFPPKKGGAQIYNWDMVRALPREKVVILAPKRQGWAEFDRESGYKTFRLREEWMEKMIIPALIVIVPLLALREDIELIWFSKYSRLSWFIVLITKSILQIPYAMSIFGEDLAWAQRDFGLTIPKIVDGLKNRLIKQADTIVAISEFSASFLPNGIAYKVVYPSIALAEGNSYSEKKNKNDDRPLGCVHFLSIGRNAKKKGFDLVLRALAKGLPNVPRYRYTIVTDKQDMLFLEKLAEELGIRQNVKIISDISEQYRRWLFINADVFVMPSRIEGFGIVFLEAAFYGLCSIGSNSGGIPEAIKNGETGLLVENENIDGLRINMSLLSTDSDLRFQLAASARHRCIKEFSWPRFADQWRNLFLQMK